MHFLLPAIRFGVFYGAILCPAFGGILLVTGRESNASLNVLAGSGGAVSQFSESDAITTLNGSFSFSETFGAGVTTSTPLSNGTASANGSITVSDSVVSSASLLQITATRDASGTALWEAGTGNSLSTAISELTVDFTVVDEAAYYTLQGNFNPGTVNGVSAFRIGRPFASFDIVDINGTSVVLNQDGYLPPNEYQFRVRITDQVSASSGDPSDADTSSYNLTFQVQAVPEPSAAILLTICGAAALVRRRRSS